MNQDKVNKIYILLFLIILSLPLMLLIFRIKIDDPYSSKKINANFTKNFPLKQDYFSIYYKIKEDVFNCFPFPEKVFKLNDGWYFLGDKDSNNLSESKGYLLFTKNEIKRLVENLTYKRDWCQKNKIDYIMTIAPNKESVYGNLIPISQFGTNKKMIQLDSICKSLGVKFVNLGRQIPNNQKMISYHKTDTHWNHYGSYFGYKEFIEKMNLWYPNKSIEKPFPLYSYNFEKRWDENVGDLKHMANKQRGEEIIVLVSKNEEKAKITNQRIIPKYKIFVDPKEYEVRFIAPVKNTIKILFLRDSFSGYLMHYIKEHFKESIFIYQRDFDLHLLKKENPGFIIEEIVERDVDLLIDESRENIINK